jgi:hypothetical protein
MSIRRFDEAFVSDETNHSAECLQRRPEVSLMTGESDQTSPEPEQIDEANKESIGKIKSLVDELKIVEEHEKGVLGE